MRRAFAFLSLAVVLFLSAGTLFAAERTLPAPTPTSKPGLDAADDPLKSGPVQVMIEMTGEPALKAYIRAKQKGQPQNAAAAAHRDQVLALRAAQTPVEAALAQTPGARVLYSLQKAANGVVALVDRKDMARLRTLPNVKRVYVMALHERDNSSSVPFLGIPASFWSGLSVTGQGMRVAVIDTGIDYLHSNMGGSGIAGDYAANDSTIIEPGSFPTAKVVDGWDFVGNAYTGANAAVPDPDPLDCNGHGSHVAGTVAGLGVNTDGSTFAGPWDETVPFASLKIGPGVAPEATLLAYKVFGCSGSTGYTAAAIELAIDPNGDNDPSDHPHVINMSLGSSFGSPYDTSAQMTDLAAEAGIIVVTSAGNAYDTHFISGSPGIAGRAIATASVLDSGNYVNGVATVNSPASIAGPKAGGYALYGPVPPVGGITGDVLLADDAVVPINDGCTAISTDLTGKIALVDRGTCSFKTKTLNAQNAGAIGVIVANNTGTAPGNMADDATIVTPITIPTVLVTQAAGNEIKGKLPTDTVNATITYTNGADTVSSFSSRGPARDGFLKPDIAAPGDAITSTSVGTGNGALTIGGTSMASPHVAGFMALLRQIHPTWTVEELKALAMNTATDSFTQPNHAGLRHSPQRIGAGRVDAAAAANGQVIAYNYNDSGRVSVSFGTQVVTEVTTLTKEIHVVNKGNTAVAYDVAYDVYTDAEGAEVAVSPATVNIPAGGSAHLTVTLTIDPALVRNTHDAALAEFQSGFPRTWITEESGMVKLTGPTGEVRVPVHAIPRAGGTSTSDDEIPVSAASGTADLFVQGNGILQNGWSDPPYDILSVASMFELQAYSEDDAFTTGLADNADLKYVGVGSDFAAGEVYFGVSTWGKWATLNETAFYISLDMDQNGTWDYYIYNTSPVVNNARTDLEWIRIVNIGTGAGAWGALDPNLFAPTDLSMATYNNDVVLLPLLLSQVAVAGDASPAFDYIVESNSRDYGWADATAVLTYDPSTPGVQFLLYEDVPQFFATVPVGYDLPALAANGSLGGMILHHHNGNGTRAEVFTFAPCSASIDPEILNGGRTGQPYWAMFTASGGSGNYTWSIYSGSLPPGMTLNPATGVLSGTPTTAGIYEFVVEVTDNLANCKARVTHTIEIVWGGPIADSITPNNGSHLGGTVITLTGSQFVNGATVTIGGQAAATVFDSVTSLTVTAPALAPGALYDVVVMNPDGQSATLPKAWLADFLDVPQSHGFHNFVEAIFRAGITGGCGGGNFCPNNRATRAQMAVFLLVAQEGPTYTPPPATGTMFGDVAANSFAAAWIEELANRGVTAGCGGGNYCPNNSVTRAQMAVFLLATFEGTGYVPPAATGDFDDVPVSSGFAPWIEEIFARGITGGCSTNPPLYCPTSSVTRGQMAVFLTTTWSLPMN